MDGGTGKIYPTTGGEWSGNEGNVESVLYMRWGCVEEMRERDQCFVLIQNETGECQFFLCSVFMRGIERGIEE